MALSNCYSSLAGPDIILTEYRFHIHSMEKGIRKLQNKFYRDPTVRSKVLALLNCYFSLAGQDVLLNEYRFHMHSIENGIRKLH
jgi:hypothetical protein